MKQRTKSAAGQPSVTLDSEVVRQIRQHARSSNKAEICGVLIGREHERSIEVSYSIEGQNAEEGGAHVTFTQDTWEHIYAVKDRKYPDTRIVGWYHSHPGFGVFLSEHDTFIHRNFFSSPGQVAWVFDPQSDEEGCFGWVDGNIERLTKIAVLDRRGGERADFHPGPERVNRLETDDNQRPVSEEEKDAIHVHRSETAESGESTTWSLELLVTRVFMFLAALGLGFALSWYFFPRIMIMPVPVDPISGRPIDPQTGQILHDPDIEKAFHSERADPAKSEQSGSQGANHNKGDDGKP